MRASTDAPIPRIVMDTEGLPPARATAIWREQIGVMFDSQPLSNGREDPRYRVEACHLGALAVGMASMTQQRFQRPASRVWRDGLDHYLLQFYTHGSCRSLTGRHPPGTTPGDLWVTDLGQPLSTEINTATNLTLVAPRAQLESMLHEPDGQHQRVLDGRLPLVTLLREHLKTILQTSGQMRASHAVAITPTILALAAAALNGAPTETQCPASAAGIKLVLLHHIDQNLHDSQLSPARLAVHAGLSLRTLQYLFEADGGAARYIQRRRLQKARQLLCSPGRWHTEIASDARLPPRRGSASPPWRARSDLPTRKASAAPSPAPTESAPAARAPWRWRIAAVQRHRPGRPAAGMNGSSGWRDARRAPPASWAE